MLYIHFSQIFNCKHHLDEIEGMIIEVGFLSLWTNFLNLHVYDLLLLFFLIFSSRFLLSTMADVNYTKLYSLKPQYIYGHDVANATKKGIQEVTIFIVSIYFDRFIFVLIYIMKIVGF